ncbi:carbohydrate kinase family protein [Georgenia sp. Z1491]|uniref:carbohydrate kinase family protein n=1 Tax=Georgenia sp. Z1491 TaxID=3416707 RepID=UPI003CF2245F
MSGDGPAAGADGAPAVGSTAGQRVLVVGEALVDVFPDEPGGPARASGRVPGGSPANMAVGLARLGLPVALLTHLGDDEDGALVLEHLTDAGVEVLDGSVVEGRTSTAVATVDEAGVPAYEFDVAWQLPDVATIEIPEAVHVGSYAAFVEPGATRVREVAARAAAEGAIVSFDPNIRAALLPPLAQVQQGYDALAAHASVVKISDEDAEWLFPDLTDEEVVAHTLALGPRLVVLTLGAEGAILADQARSVRVPRAQVDVVDTVGAGDSYMAALIDSLLTLPGGAGPVGGDGAGDEPLDLERIGRRSAAASGITVSRRGADLPTAAELDQA